MSITFIVVLILFLLCSVISFKNFFVSSLVVNKLTPRPDQLNKELENYSGALLFYDEMTNIDIIKILPKVKKRSDILLCNVLDQRQEEVTSHIIERYKVRNTPTLCYLDQGELVEKYSETKREGFTKTETTKDMLRNICASPFNGNKRKVL